MTYKKYFNNLLLIILLFSSVILPMKIYKIFFCFNCFPSIEISIAYLLYKNKKNLLLIYLYLFFNDLVYSNFIISNIICFFISIKVIENIDKIQDINFVGQFIQILIYSTSFLFIKYAIIFVNLNYFLGFTNFIFQIILCIIFCLIIKFVTKYKY